MSRLSGKTALITGAARGMGRATAEVFAAAGARVVVCDVLAQEGETVASQIGEAAVFHHLDVSDESNWEAVVADTVVRWGTIDVLVNNAGIAIYDLVVQMAKADFEKVLSVNLVGTFLGVKHVGRVMSEKGRGSIINVSSTTAFQANNGMSAYGTSKWGIRGLTKIAAMELGLKGVRVNSIHPGPVNTPMTNPVGATSQELSQLPVFTRQPIQRVAEPEEIARVSLFLASDDASYMTGAEVVVDGGMIIGDYLETLPGSPR